MSCALILEVPESIHKVERNSLSNTVPMLSRPSQGGWQKSEGLYDREGGRKYVNNAELCRVVSATHCLDLDRSLFAQLLAYTGARVSEALALTPASFQIESGVVTFTTLKRRKPCLREVPVPPHFMKALALHFDLQRAQQNRRASKARIWSWCRTTAWRIIKKVMALANVFGRQACPRGLRHGFGVGMLITHGNLNLIQRWMGHSRLSTTMIYTSVCGPEEKAFAKRFWDSIQPHAKRGSTEPRAMSLAA